MSFNLDKGINAGVQDYVADSYNFVTKNAYSIKYWEKKGVETFQSVVFISDINKIRPDGSTNGIDLFNSVSRASAYDVGHFVGYNSAQFATTYALSEGSGFLLNSIRSTPKIGEFGIAKIDFCFIKGTLISTAGGFKNIEDIEKGDLVWSYNTEKGEKELKKVLALSRNTSSSLVKISLAGTEITCTPEHPFYVNGDWIEAKYLSKVMILTTLNGNISVVKSINFLDGNVEVYNFEVEDNHNYYVSKKGILVHNNCDFVRKLFANNINDVDIFSVQLKKIGNPVSNITKNPGLAKAKIPGIDLSSLPSWSKEELTTHLGELMEGGKITRPTVEKFMKSFNKAFENRSTGGNLGKKQ